MAGKTGMAVLYTPTAEQAANFNNYSRQIAAVITSWDEESEKAALVLFVPGASFVTALNGVIEGVDPGEFQQFATDVAKSSGQGAAQHKAKV
jgi:hypothetical protein